MVPLTSFGISDIGLSRANNEDVWVALPEIGFFALADGMGGHLAGEVAAKETLEFLATFIKKVKTRDPMELVVEVRQGIEQVNCRIYQMGRQSEEFCGMGTTLCCMLWTERAVIYAHVGDSRIYRLREEKLQLLTRDHSFFTKWLKVKKQKKSTTPYPYKNVITRSIGVAGKARPEICVSSHGRDDLYILCSDGLSDVLPLSEMEGVLNDSRDLSRTAARLIDTAKFKGGCDNMTVLMVRFDGENLSRQQCDDGS